MRYRIQFLLFRLIRWLLPIIKWLDIPLPLFLWTTFDLKEHEISSNKNEWDKFVYDLFRNQRWGRFKFLMREFQSRQEQAIEEYIENLERQYERKISELPLNVLKEKVEYLQNQFNLEKQRQSNLDSKTIQIITQSSIVTTIIALMIPLLIDKINFNKDFKEWLFWIFILLLVWTLTLFVRSIIIAIKNLKTTGYSRPMHTMILHHSDGNVKKMYESQLTNFYNSTNYNIKVNNKKASEINKSYRHFRLGLILFVITAFTFVFYRFCEPFEDIKKVHIENNVTTKRIDEIIHRIESKADEFNTSIRNLENEMRSMNIKADSASTEIKEINDKMK